MIILGIDPGLRKTGFGLVEIKSGSIKYLKSGIIATTTQDSLPNRLKSILNGISEVILVNKPDSVSIEKVFLNSNPQSTLLLGQARGAAIAACVLHDLEVFEYTALQIKKAVVGYGHAEKQQIGKMIKYLLNLNGEPSSDAADALAVALTHFYHLKSFQSINITRVKKGRIIST